MLLGMFTSSSTTAQPTEVLATYAANQVAATIFFYVLPTLGTQLGINCNPVLRFVMTLFIPKLPNEAGTRRMWFSQTIEAKLVSTNALDLTVNISFNKDGISIAGNTWAPFHFVGNTWAPFQIRSDQSVGLLQDLLQRPAFLQCLHHT